MLLYSKKVNLIMHYLIIFSKSYFFGLISTGCNLFLPQPHKILFNLFAMLWLLAQLPSIIRTKLFTNLHPALSPLQAARCSFRRFSKLRSHIENGSKLHNSVQTQTNENNARYITSTVDIWTFVDYNRIDGSV